MSLLSLEVQASTRAHGSALDLEGWQVSLPPCRGPADLSQDHPLFWTLCSDLLRPTQVPREPVANADLHLPLLLPDLLWSR